MESDRPSVPDEIVAKWQRVVDLAARIVEVPSCLVMRTEAPDHAVLVTSHTDGNPYSVGQSFVLNRRLYCHSVLANCDELVVRDALSDPDWGDNQDLEHGMTFYIGYPLQWPDGALFGTICVLDRRDNEKAHLYRTLLQEFRGVVESDLAQLCEVDRRTRLEAQLHDTLELLERRVEDRTQALALLNDGLQDEIVQRRNTEADLIRNERALEEANAALRVLLQNLESSRQDFEARILRQLKGLVLPHLARLRKNIGQREPDRSYLELVEHNLQNITSAYAGNLATAFEVLTPTEIEAAQLVLNGQNSKDISRVLAREKCTIDFHRNNIRKKLGIKRRDVNLRSHLMSLQ